MPGILDIINDAATSSGIDADYLARIAKIESGGNPKAKTGSYKGLFQLSPSEFSRYGGGDIYNPVDNARSAAAMMADQRNAFSAKYGRPPTPTEAYMIHQQGAGGTDAHLANPNAPAWENMASTAEGRQKGAGWAKQAIWGNIPDNLKARFGSINNVTSADFINMWRNKVEPGSEPVSFPSVQSVAAHSGSAGAPLFAGGPQNTSGGVTPQPNPFAGVTQSGLNMMQPSTQPDTQASQPSIQASQPQALSFPAMRPLAQLQRPQVDYSGLRAFLSGRNLTPLA